MEVGIPNILYIQYSPSQFLVLVHLLTYKPINESQFDLVLKIADEKPETVSSNPTLAEWPWATPFLSSLGRKDEEVTPENPTKETEAGSPESTLTWR